MVKITMYLFSVIIGFSMCLCSGFAKQGPFKRIKRQENMQCVPRGTCITPSPGIDERIGEIPTCEAGQEMCAITVQAARCGLRHITNAVTSDGPATPGAFPWQVYLRNGTNYIGSGVLVDQRIVLTVAHKVFNQVRTPGNIVMNFGISDPATSGAISQQRKALAIVVHANFNSSTLKNDIALIVLDSPVYLGFQRNIGAACLPPANVTFIGQRCTVSGWGKQAFNSQNVPTVQKQVTMPIVNYTVCRNSMAQANILGSYVDYYLDPVGELCAGGETDKDACTYDGGAPLVCPDSQGRFYVVGLVNWGKNCGQPGVYGVYVNVAAYLPWVSAVLQSLQGGK